MKVLYQVTIGFAILQLISAQCLQCTSRDTSKNCVNPDGVLYSGFCQNGPECYSRVVNGDTIRGCAYQLEPEVKQKCTNATDDNQCYICNTSNCNLGLYPVNRLMCHFCDQTTTGVNCTASIVGRAQACPFYAEDDKCITRKEGEQVIRQCLSNYEDCRKDKNCKICDFHGCNNLEYSSAVTCSIHNTVFFTGLAYFLSKVF